MKKFGENNGFYEAENNRPPLDVTAVSAPAGIVTDEPPLQPQTPTESARPDSDAAKETQVPAENIAAPVPSVYFSAPYYRMTLRHNELLKGASFVGSEPKN